MKKAFHQEDIIIVNIYSSHIGAPKYIKQILMVKKGEIDSNIIIVGDVSLTYCCFSPSLSPSLPLSLKEIKYFL